MHWHAIRQSTGSCESGSSPAQLGSSTFHEHDKQDVSIEDDIATMNIPFGHDNAADIRLPFEPSLILAATKLESTSEIANDEIETSVDEDDYIQVAIPWVSDGLTPYAYQLALQNRIKNDKLTRHGEYDMGAYKPTFIHDCLMLPGSLASFLGKRSSDEVIRRMTPAFLPGFHAYVHADTQEPCILQSADDEDYVQGMVIFAQGKKARRLIHKHYRANARRVTVDVEIDVAVPVPYFQRVFPTEHWRLMRRTIRAHAWIWSNVGSGDVQFRTQAPRWTLEAYISGSLGPVQSLRIEEAAYLDDEVFVAEKDDADEREKREAVDGGGGHLDYDRMPGFTGW